MQESFYESGNCVQIICAIQGVHPKSFSPTSVQFKGKINDALPRKRHQKRHLEFCTAYLLSRGSPVRGWPGAPLFWNSLKQYELDKTVFTPAICFFDRWSEMVGLWRFSFFFYRSNCLRELNSILYPLRIASCQRNVILIVTNGAKTAA